MDTMTAPINDNSEGTEKKKATVRIVIADDHPIVRDGLKKLLLLEDDFEIVGEAGDGRDLIVKSIRKVNSGEIWLDSHTTAAVMRQFSTGQEGSGGTSSGGKSRERSP